MGILNIAIVVLALFAARLIGKIIWKSGFLAGTHHEAMMWLNSIDKLFVPNWQSLRIGKDEGLNSEELEYANRIYAAAYQTALDHIKMDIASIRRETIAKLQAENDAASSGYPV